MKINAFKSGQYKQNFQYKSFTPSFINHEWTWDDPVINVLLENATRALASLDAYSMIVPDIDLFIRMHMLKEANTSSRIEGTKTRLEKAAISMNRRAESALKLINLLYRKPIIHYQNVCDELSLTPRPANELLRAFIDKGILVEITGKQRNKKYGFEPYLKIFARHNEVNNDRNV